VSNYKCAMPLTHFGGGKLNDLGELVGEFGSRAMLAIDPFLDKSGLSERLTSILKNARIEVTVWSDIQPNPSCFGVDEAAQTAREEKCDFVVAVGGGSSMDFGKAVAVAAANQGNSCQYTERSDYEILRLSRTVSVVAIPTTAGTGSEAIPSQY